VPKKYTSQTSKFAECKQEKHLTNKQVSRVFSLLCVRGLFADCIFYGTQQIQLLPSVFLLHSANWLFAECLTKCTLQRAEHGKQPISGNDAYFLYKQTSELVYATASTVSMELSLLCPSSAQEE
jgi:hypothetical protein